MRENKNTIMRARLCILLHIIYFDAVHMKSTKFVDPQIVEEHTIKRKQTHMCCYDVKYDVT